MAGKYNHHIGDGRMAFYHNYDGKLDGRPSDESIKQSVQELLSAAG